MFTVIWRRVVKNRTFRFDYVVERTNFRSRARSDDIAQAARCGYVRIGQIGDDRTETVQSFVIIPDRHVSNDDDDRSLCSKNKRRR